MKESSRFTHDPPDRAFHGTTCLNALHNGIPSADTNLWFTRVRWEAYDRWMEGGPHLEEGIPYANILWESLGLRKRQGCPSSVAPWAKNIKTFAQLGEGFGFLFVTDSKQNAERYGKAHEVDLMHDAILDVIEDPHVRTHSGWIIILPKGEAVPFL